MESMNRFGPAEWHVDFGERGRLEADLEHARIWAALPEHLGAELWVKSVAGAHDFRVTLTRSRDGFEIVIDRGPKPGREWPNGVPTVAINIDKPAGSGVISLRCDPDQRIWQTNFVL